MDLDIRSARTFLNTAAKTAEYDRLWRCGDRHGRWMVIERGVGHLLDAPRKIKAIADAASRRRVRRFSSLSRARAFAHRIDGEVRRWRTEGVRWLSPWDWATMTDGPVA